MNETELIAAVFSLLSVWFSTKSNILCWPFGIIGIIAYIYVFRDQGATSNMILQSFFVIQSIYGWVTWKKEGTKKISLFNEELSATITTISILNTSPMKMQNVLVFLIGLFMLGDMFSIKAFQIYGKHLSNYARSRQTIGNCGVWAQAM